MNARIIKDSKGNAYLNSHMNRETIQRFSTMCDQLRMILRYGETKNDNTRIDEEHDRFPSDIAELICCYNPYKPLMNFVNLKEYRNMKKAINESVRWADKIR